MNREEHLQWAKDRALAELDADPHERGPVNALSSLISDLGKHQYTADHAAIGVTGMLMLAGSLTTAEDVRKHINGFN